MFEYGSVKLLLLAIVALVVVGPKEFPVLLRTIGKYMGMVRRQAAEFRQQWDDAVRESELSSLKNEVEQVGQDLQSTIHETEASISSDINAAQTSVEAAVTADPTPAPELPPPPSEPPSPAAQAAAAAARAGV
jgi:sec-independent protein translocase protein TatB